MECHEGAKMIKTFRGLMENGAQDTIVLHTNDGKTGYRIVKFQVTSATPVNQNAESVFQIFRKEQATVSTGPAVVDFSDNTLLGIGIWTANTTASTEGPTMHIIFDREIFNQDIFITYTDELGTLGGNYYLELEQMSLDLNESTVATLKDIRNERASITG